MLPTRYSVLSWLWLQAFAACVLAMLPLLVWSWWTPAPYGDLTRIGRLSESDFGWKARQPGVDAGLLRSVEINEADVLVIGDSFSAGLLWQSELVARGWRVTTLNWNAVKGICSDFEPWLRRQGFKGRVVVLQKVERNLPDLVRESHGCRHMASPGHVSARRHVSEPPTKPPAAAANWKAPLDLGAKTRWHTWHALHTSADYVIQDAGHVRVASIVGGCALFSHEACTRGLFLADDLDLAPVTAEHVVALPGILSSSPGLNVVWAVTPNKSTIYLQHERARSISSTVNVALASPGHGPDLFGLLMDHRDEFKDLYFSNDTHLSNRGYLLMGASIAEAVAKAMTPKSDR